MKLVKTAIVISICALLLSTLQYFKINKQKVAYVFVNEVVAEYHAMQDIDDKLRLNEALEKEKLDKFYTNIQNKINWLKENHQEIEKNEVVDKQHEIIDLEQIYNSMQEKTFKKLDSIKISWTTPVYDEVNDYIKTYSEKEGYDYVLGNLGNGNIMYGNHLYNITLEIIDNMNVIYNKKNLELNK